jgi:hypothetical protein
MPLTRPRLAKDEKDNLLRHLLRVPELFQAARDRLTAYHFDARAEADLRLVWLAATASAREYGHGSLPADPLTARAVLETKARALMDQDPLLAAACSHLCDDNGLFAWLFSDTAALDREWGRQLLLRFLEERDVSDRLTQLVTAAAGNPLTDLPAFLTDLQAAQGRVALLSREPGYWAAPEGYEPPTLHKASTGLPWLNVYMNGGDAPGEVYGLLGAFGSGKTLFAVQAAVAKARQLLVEHAAGGPGHVLRHACVFHYEAGRDEFVRRVWSNAAQIDSNTLEVFNAATLSTRGHLKPYELELFAPDIAARGLANVDGECERLEQVKAELLRRNLRLFDFSGPKEAPEQGTGYVDEIAAALEQEERNGRPPGVVFVDYAGIACKRYIRSKNLRIEEMRHLVGGFGDECRRKIAARFGCRVWVLHQLSGEANKRSFRATQSHADAAESKSFAENLWFCFELGTKDPGTGITQLHCSKQRRATGLAAPPLLKIDGPLQRLLPVSGYVLDAHSAAPVPAAYHHVLHGPGPGAGREAPADPTEVDLDAYEA